MSKNSPFHHGFGLESQFQCQARGKAPGCSSHALAHPTMWGLPDSQVGLNCNNEALYGFMVAITTVRWDYEPTYRGSHFLRAAEVTEDSPTEQW